MFFFAEVQLNRNNVLSGVTLFLIVIGLIVRFSFRNNSYRHAQKEVPQTQQSSGKNTGGANSNNSNTGDANSQNSSGRGLNRQQDHLQLTRHAKCRMDCRHITETEIKEILHDGNINYNKSQLHDERGPKYAVEGYTHEHTHLRVIFAPESKVMVVVTCIDLDTEWQCPTCN